MEERNEREAVSPLQGLDPDFRKYVKQRKAMEKRHMSGNGLPDYAFALDFEYRKKLDAMPGFYQTAKKICATYASRAATARGSWESAYRIFISSTTRA